MSLIITDDENYTSIADAIRTKTLTSELLLPSEMGQMVSDYMIGCDQIAQVAMTSVNGLASSIAQNAFAGLSSIITAVNFPYCVTVGRSAFLNCQHMSELSIPMCVEIGSSAFASCVALTSLSLPACTTLRDRAFFGCTNVSEIYIPVAQTIYTYAFANCRLLGSLDAPACTTVGTHCFEGCSSLSTISLPECSTVGESAFAGCSLVSVIDLPLCETVGANAFINMSSVSMISLPLCKTINAGAFQNCKSVTTVTFPECSYVGNGAFRSCLALSEAFLPACLSLNGSVFLGCPSFETLYVPACEYISARQMLAGTIVSTLSMPMLKTILNGSNFLSCTTLMSLYLLGPSVVTLSNVNNFANSPMSLSTYTGSFGSIYVPESLYASYVIAINWSAYSARIVSVSLLPEAEVADVFGDDLAPYNPVGVEFTSVTMTDGVADIEAREWSAGYEGFQIEIPNLEKDTTYRLSFDIQFVDTTFNGTKYRVGHMFSKSAVTAYNAYSTWTENVTRNLEEQHFEYVFETPYEKMYLSFNLSGLTDKSGGASNTFTIRNLKVEKVRWDL